MKNSKDTLHTHTDIHALLCTLMDTVKHAHIHNFIWQFSSVTSKEMSWVQSTKTSRQASKKECSLDVSRYGFLLPPYEILSHMEPCPIIADVSYYCSCDLFYYMSCCEPFSFVSSVFNHLNYSFKEGACF